MSDLERKVELYPAYDRRDPDPSKDYGIHGVDMRFILLGPAGAVQFVIYTGWHLPEPQEELDRKILDNPSLIRIHGPVAADVGYHSPKPIHEGQEPLFDEPCPYIGVPCYYDGSGLHAKDVFKLLVREGGEAMWLYLENYYRETFGVEETDA